MYQRGTFSSATATAPISAFRSDAFGSHPPVAAATNPHSYSTSPSADRSMVDRVADPTALSASNSDSASTGVSARPAPALMIRRLPRNTSGDTLMSMLIFAGDLIDTEFIRSPYPDDQGFATAVARFRTHAGAVEAQQKLNGKPNTAREANMVVELHGAGTPGSLERRTTTDSSNSRAQTSSASSAASSSLGAGAGPGRSRFGSAFQSNDKLSPPLPTPSSAGSGNDFPVPDSHSHFQSLFSPHSPLVNGFDERHRISGKSLINDSAADEETGELLKDPVAYAKSGQHPGARRPTNPQMPVARFANLSLSTSNGMPSPAQSGVTSPRGGPALQSPLSPSSMASIGANNPSFSLNYPRPQYPPVNPADQNPPCNTLYVGNLPIDASEDELKAIFSKQRGYRRLCFRTKQNGPMCFVEFEDVSFATKALNELYGHPLHNSVKGGIRLSFSKNPLGVRSGQTNGLPAPTGQLSQQAPGASAYSNGAMTAAGFSSVSGPPPGLAAPPGLVNGGFRSPLSAAGMDALFSTPAAMPALSFSEQMSPRNLSGGVPPAMSGQYGRESRAGYTDYMLGR